MHSQQFTKYLRLFIIFLMLSCCDVAIASEIVVDFGLEKFTPSANGNWKQNGFPNNEHLISPSVSFGLYTDINTYGTQFGVGFDWVGRMTADAMILNSDANYNPNSASHCNGPCGPLSHMQTQATVSNIFLAVRQNYGNWWGEIQLTATTYHLESINYDWYGPGNTSAVGPIVSQLNADARTQYGLGATIGYKLPYKIANEPISLFLKIEQSHTSEVDGLKGLSKAVSPTLGIEIKF
jgi:hypothetical protein